jgi:hypothetical protein
MKYFLSVLISSSFLFHYVLSFANPGDVTIYNAPNNNGSLNFYFVIDGAKTAWTGAINPSDYRTLTASAFGKNTGNLSIYMCNTSMVSDNCNNIANWKSAINNPVVYSYQSTQSAISLTCWYDANHTPGCSTPIK